LPTPRLFVNRNWGRRALIQTDDELSGSAADEFWARLRSLSVKHDPHDA